MGVGLSFVGAANDLHADHPRQPGTNSRAGVLGLVLLLACGGGGGATSDASVDAGEDATVATDAGVDAPPVVASCAPAEGCDPVAQDCADESDGCYPAEDGTVCRPRGVLGERQPCARDVDCRPGLFCDGEPAVCTRFCCPASSSGGCLPGTACVGFEGVLHGACRASCDPTSAPASDGACAEGEACYATDGRGGTACLPTGTLDAGDPCTRANDCAAGLACLAVDDASPRCLALCRSDDDCDRDDRCASLGGSVAVCEPSG
jgi:hypothetical protein